MPQQAAEYVKELGLAKVTVAIPSCLGQGLCQSKMRLAKLSGSTVTLGLSVSAVAIGWV